MHCCFLFSDDEDENKQLSSSRDINNNTSKEIAHQSNDNISNNNNKNRIQGDNMYSLQNSNSSYFIKDSNSSSFNNNHNDINKDGDTLPSSIIDPYSHKDIVNHNEITNNNNNIKERKNTMNRKKPPPIISPPPLPPSNSNNINNKEKQDDIPLTDFNKNLTFQQQPYVSQQIIVNNNIDNTTHTNNNNKDHSKSNDNNTHITDNSNNNNNIRNSTHNIQENKVELTGDLINNNTNEIINNEIDEIITACDDEDDDNEENNNINNINNNDLFIDLTALQPDQYRFPGSNSLLPPLRSNKKSLILDLDETLVHSSFKFVPNPDFVLSISLDDDNKDNDNISLHEVYVIKRPGLEEFLQKVSQWYEIVIFTASLKKYAGPLLDIIDPNNKLIDHRLYRDSCYIYENNFIKNLSQLGRNLNDIIILDNSPSSYIFHPQHALPISSWFSDLHDNELLDILPILEDLSRREILDVGKILDVTM